MVCLEKLDRSDFEEVYRIMEQSFPADERRKKEGQQKLLDEEKYELLGVRNEGGLLAFLAVWEFAEFVFIEHFAVSVLHVHEGSLHSSDQPLHGLFREVLHGRSH